MRKNASATVRLYMLLSWLFAGYYMVVISRGSFLGDIEIACTQTSPYVPALRPSRDINRLLFKHLGKLNTCNVLKLRGVTSNRNEARKRARTSMNSYCVVFIYLTVICFVQLLRSLAHLIHDMLLRAGDVEPNPGPTPPSSPVEPLSADSAPSTPSSQDQQYPPSSVEAIDDTPPPSLEPELSEVPPQSGADGSPLPQGQTLAAPATNSLDMPADTRKMIIPPGLPVPLSHVYDPQHFPKQKEETPSDVNSATYPPAKTAHPFPQLESDTQTDSSLSVGIGYAKAEKRLHVQHDFGELHRSGSSMNFNQFKEYHSKTIYKAHERRHSISGITDVKDDRIASLTHANRLLRIGADCIYCPMCYKKKEQIIESHIFPCALLKVFKRIHCSNEKNILTEFIYDFSHDARMGSHGVTYPMLCNVCEKLCDEESLRALYIFLMDKPHTESFKVPNDDSWLQHVMANIMFRGILVSESLQEDLQDDNFLQSFTTLQEYCKSFKSKKPSLHLFLLPNRPINEELIAFLYPVEYVLRNPMFSTVVRDKKTGINFIYTKFDCFHLVLPLDNDSKAYFNRFQKGFDTFEESGHNYVYLRWTKQCISVRKIDRDTKAVKYSISEEVKPHLFPEVLLNVSLSQYKRFVSMTCSLSDKSPLTADCKIMIDLVPGLNHEHPTKDFKGDVVPTQDRPQIPEQHFDESVIFSKTLSQKELDAMIENASELSPHGLQQRKLDELGEEIKSKNDDLKRMKKVISNFQTSLEKAEKNVHTEMVLRLSLERDLTMRESELLTYEEQLHQYELKLEKVHLLLFRENRELKQCMREKKKLKAHSKTVQENLYEALKQISAELQKLPEDTNGGIRDKLLRKCHQMKSMILNMNDTSVHRSISL